MKPLCLVLLSASLTVIAFGPVAPTIGQDKKDEKKVPPAGEAKVVKRIWFPRFSPDGKSVLAACGAERFLGRVDLDTELPPSDDVLEGSDASIVGVVFGKGPQQRFCFLEAARVDSASRSGDAFGEPLSPLGFGGSRAFSLLLTSPFGE